MCTIEEEFFPAYYRLEKDIKYKKMLPEMLYTG